MAGKTSKISHKSTVSHTMIRTSIHLYVVVMVGLFVYYTTESIRKYYLQEVVKERSRSGKLTTVLPGMSLCMVPMYKKDLNVITNRNFAFYCEEEKRNNTKQCIENMSFQLKDVVLGQATIPVVQFDPVNETRFVRNSGNLWTGGCITYQNPEEKPMSQSMMDALLLDMSEDSYLAKGWSLMLIVHNRDMFLPSISIASDFVGQKFTFHTPAPYTVTAMDLEVTHVTRLQTEKHRCNDDPDYNIVRCMEEFVADNVSCSSPWDVYPHQHPECETYEEFSRLFDVHLHLNSVGGPQFQKLTRCLPPCQYDRYDMIKRNMDNAVLLASIGMNKSGVAITLRSTNSWVEKDALLYGLDNLVGDVGGFMGMFLGVSLVCIYKDLAERTKRVFNRD